MADLFGGMPCDGLDVLCVLHEHAHTFEVVIWVHWVRVSGLALRQKAG